MVLITKIELTHYLFDYNSIPMYISSGNERLHKNKNVIVALFLTTPNWKQAKSPSKVESINKCWYIHSTTLWMNLANITWNERPQTKRMYTVWFHLHKFQNSGTKL